MELRGSLGRDLTFAWINHIIKVHGSNRTH